MLIESAALFEEQSLEFNFYSKKSEFLFIKSGLLSRMHVWIFSV